MLNAEGGVWACLKPGPVPHELGVAEAGSGGGGSKVQGHPQMHSQCVANLGKMGPYFTISQKRREKSGEGEKEGRRGRDGDIDR